MSSMMPHNRQITLMDIARKKATFDTRKLTYILYDGEENVRKREAAFARVESLLSNSGPMALPDSYGNLDRTKLYREGLAYGKALLDDARQNHHTIFDHANHRYALANGSPFGLHPLMFIPSLKLQASPEQLAYWLPLAESNKIIGAYCQTELGHGTFLRGLETTSTFDATTDEFIIHSPTVSSTKYWPGGLGYSSSHAIVMARLIISGKDHGVHPFMVQLRSLENYKPMPGIELGDIGLKWGINSSDNGYAIFTHVRIPREHMLMGNARVLRDGTYIKAAHDKLAYSTMLYARYAVLHTAAFQLAQAVTIATRYSVVREQGIIENNSSEQETSIIHYKSQHYRLLSRMSQAFALVFASKTAKSTYDSNLIVSQRRGDHSGLPYVHATLAALKAYSTQVAADGAEDMRKCCGGHGYSAFSGFLELVASLTATVTLEGEMYVMYQQTARYLLKCLAKAREGEHMDPQMAYLATHVREMIDGDKNLKRCAPDSDFLDPAVQLAVFRHRVTRLISECDSLLRHSEHVDGLSSSEAWNLHMMTLISAARAHIEYFVLQSFVDLVESTTTDPALNAVLKHLCDLFALYSIESPYSQGSLGFFEDGFISPKQLRAIRARVHALCDELIPNAIALTDAWNFSDASLVSALGKKDGNVYETMLSWTRQVPLNVEARRTGGVDVEGYLKYIRPLLNAKL